MSSKVTKEGTSKLLRLLYDSTSTEARKRTPLVTNHLYKDPTTTTITGSVLDNLMENDWNQKPLAQAIHDLPKVSATEIKSNILHLKCPNSLMVNADFHNVYPVQRDRIYTIPPTLKSGINFWAIKSRNPHTLTFNNRYYLIFPNHNYAAAYWLETRNKVINGFPLQLLFVNCQDHLKYMSSPWLDFDNNDNYNHNGSDSLELPSLHLPLVDTFKNCPEKSNLMHEILNKSFDTNFEKLSQFIDFPVRNSCVLVRNLPFGLSNKALPRLLWDYDFPDHLSIGKCFVQILRDPLSQVNLTLIRFRDHENARRFVRSFHGKKWFGCRSKSDREKVKRLYEPILCEIVN